MQFQILLAMSEICPFWNPCPLKTYSGNLSRVILNSPNIKSSLNINDVFVFFLFSRRLSATNLALERRA